MKIIKELIGFIIFIIIIFTITFSVNLVYHWALLRTIWFEWSYDFFLFPGVITFLLGLVRGSQVMKFLTNVKNYETRN